MKTYTSTSYEISNTPEQQTIQPCHKSSDITPDDFLTLENLVRSDSDKLLEELPRIEEYLRGKLSKSITKGNELRKDCKVYKDALQCWWVASQLGNRPNSTRWQALMVERKDKITAISKGLTVWRESQYPQNNENKTQINLCLETEAAIVKLTLKGNQTAQRHFNAFEEKLSKTPTLSNHSWSRIELGKEDVDLHIHLCEALSHAYLAFEDYRRSAAYGNLEKCLRAGSSDQLPYGYSVLGQAHSHSGDHDLALRCYQKELELCGNSLTDLSRKSTAHNNLGRTYLLLKETALALEAYECALEISRKAQDRGAESSACFSLSLLYEHLAEQNKEQENVNMRYSTVYKKLQVDLNSLQLGLSLDPAFAGQVHRSIGFSYSELGDDERSIEEHRQALQCWKNCSDSREKQAEENNFLAKVLFSSFSSSNHRLAIVHWVEAKELYTQVDNQKAVARALLCLGDVYLSFHEYRQAKSSYLESLELAAIELDLTSSAQAHTGLGLAHTQLGNPAEGVAQYKKALQANEKIKDMRGQCLVHSRLCFAYASLGNYSWSIRHGERGLELAGELDVEKSKHQIIALNHLGLAHVHLGEYTLAIEDNHKALSIIEEAAEMKPFTLNCLGEAYLALGKYGGGRREHFQWSIAEHSKARSSAKQLRVIEEEIRAANGIGRAQSHLGNYQEAIENHKSALSLSHDIEHIAYKAQSCSGMGIARHGLSGYDQAIEYHKRAKEYFIQLDNQEGIADALYQSALAYRGKRELEEAEKLLVSSRKSYDELWESVSVDSPAKITMLQKHALSAIELEKTLLDLGKKEEALAITDSRRSKALTGKLCAELGTKLRSLRPLSAAEMQLVAAQHEAVFLVYSTASLDSRKLSVWVISEQEVAHKWINLKQEDLDSFLQELNSISRGDHFPAGECARSKTDVSADVEEIIDKLESLLKNMYIKLVKPILSFLKEGNAYIVPEGSLLLIPFGGLLSRSGTHFIEEHPLSIIPSIRTLQLLSCRTVIKGDRALLVHGPELQFGAEEIRRVCELMPGETTSIEQGTLEEVVKLLQQEWRYMHLVCHGEVGLKPNTTPHSVFEGGFHVSKGDTPLYAHHINQLNLRAELVSMSACDSGTGKIQKEGVIGPVWSFLAAGATSTLATYWPQPDVALSVDVASEFYKAIFEEKVQNKAHALQRAILNGITTVSDDRENWCDFLLSGFDLFLSGLMDSKKGNQSVANLLPDGDN